MKFNKHILVALVLYCLPGKLYCQTKNGATTEKGYITIAIEFQQAKPSDSLFLAIDNLLYKNSDKNNIGWYAAKAKGKRFQFIVPVTTKNGYWDLYKNRTSTSVGGGSNHMLLMQDFYWEKGDSITVYISNKETQAGIHSAYTFEGLGSAKYNARNEVNLIFKATELPSAATFKEIDENLKFHQLYQNAVDNALMALSNFKGRISKSSYEVLTADIIFESNRTYNFPKRISDYYLKHIAEAPDSIKTKFLSNYKAAFGSVEIDRIPMSSLAESRNYLFYLCNRFKYEGYFLNKVYDRDWVIKNIIKSTSGVIRDRILAATFLLNPRFNNIDQLYKDANAVMTDSLSLAVLSNLQRAAPGKPLENFNLPDVNGKRVRLSDFKGKVVLIDFWFNGCPGCAVLYKSALSKIEDDFKNIPDVAFISICGDNSKDRWISGIRSGIYTSGHAINLYTDGMGFKHPVVVNNVFGGFPFVIILDKEGVIRYFNSSDIYQYDGLTKALKSLIL